MDTMSEFESDDGSTRAEERALLERLRAADDHAYERFVRGYGGRMLAVARRLLGDEEDARDCVQDAFVQAFRNIQGFEHRSSLASWLHRIVVNAALMKLRARERHPEDSVDELLPRYDDYGFRVQPEGRVHPSSEGLLADAETHDLVRRYIQRLPETHRSVLLLRDMEGYDTEETARLLGVTPGTVKTRLHRARAALKALLTPVLRGKP
jgi:RNA polymerase sigma-70 factor (ECF subfamily)